VAFSDTFTVHTAVANGKLFTRGWGLGERGKRTKKTFVNHHQHYYCKYLIIILKILEQRDVKRISLQNR
jgi:hypothetical protein